MPSDDETPKPKGRTVGADLSALSVGDLRDYIGELEREIARVRAEIEAKGAARGGAEALFGR